MDFSRFLPATGSHTGSSPGRTVTGKCARNIPRAAESGRAINGSYALENQLHALRDRSARNLFACMHGELAANERIDLLRACLGLLGIVVGKN
jgi:hypothetical protein